MRFARRVGEVGVDVKRLEVAGHQKRRVVQLIAVTPQLVVSRIQIAVGPFVFPSKVVALEHISKPARRFATGLLFDNQTLKGEVHALPVHLAGTRMAKQRAQIKEMFLCRRALRARGVVPCGYKLSGRHRQTILGRSRRTKQQNLAPARFCRV